MNNGWPLDVVDDSTTVRASIRLGGPSQASYPVES